MFRCFLHSLRGFAVCPLRLLSLSCSMMLRSLFPISRRASSSMNVHIRTTKRSSHRGSSSSVVRQRNNDGHLASPSRLNPSGSEPQRHKAHHLRSRTAVPDNEPGPSSLSLGTMIEYTHGSKCTIFSDDITGPCQMSGNPTNNRVFSEPMEDWKCISRESKGKVSLPGIAVTNGYSKEMSVMPNDSHVSSRNWLNIAPATVF